MKLAVVGSGVVGQATGKVLASKGNHSVTFVDVNQKTIQSLRQAGYRVITPDELTGTTAEVFFVSVPTPSLNGRMQLDFLVQAAINLAERVLAQSSRRPVVVVRSTVPPGTTANLVTPLLEKHSHKKAGRDFGVAMNPEYLREESAVDDFAHPRLITIGVLDDATKRTLAEVYQPFNKPVNWLSPVEAEAQKYVHNLFNACKISFFNEMRLVCQETGIDADKIFPLVARSAEGNWNPAYGTKNLGPFSGSCLPKDTSAFLNWAEDNLKTPLTLLKAVIDVNERLKSTLPNGQGKRVAAQEHVL